MDYKERLELKNKQIEEARAILEKHGIKMFIDACGCCGSPWVKMDYQGKRIIFNPEADSQALIESPLGDHAEYISLNMFPVEKGDA